MFIKREPDTDYRYQLKAALHFVGYKTQREFADAAGMESSEISKIVQGRVYPYPGQLKKIAGALSMSMTKVRSLL